MRCLRRQNDFSSFMLKGLLKKKLKVPWGIKMRQSKASGPLLFESETRVERIVFEDSSELPISI